MARTGKPKTLTMGALARLDVVCSRLAVHVDRLASLAHARDDGAITRLALDAESTCRTLHAVYADLAASVGSEAAAW